MASATSIAEKALKAFNKPDYPEAISLYTQALSFSPEVPDYYLKRSAAYQRSAQYQLALNDAEIAVMLANKRGKREQIGSGQLRRGIALYLLGRFGDAAFCFNEAKKRCSEKERNMLSMWIRKVEMAMDKLDDEHEAREATVDVIPDADLPVIAAPQKAETSETTTTTTATTTTPPAPPAVGVVTPASKIRHEWYQTPTHVVVTIYAKGVPKDQAVVEIADQTISVSFPLSSGSDYTFDIDPLFDTVVPSGSSYSIMSTKVELKLQKANQNRKWADLEGELEVVASTDNKVEVEKKVDKPVYPSSSKTGPKDWDRLAKDLLLKEKKENAKDGEDQDGDGEGRGVDDSDEESDPVNSFFKKLYKGADEDTRRAMMKSYVESNGTALSTNWSEVGKAPVETSPPDGMEAKQWGK